MIDKQKIDKVINNLLHENQMSSYHKWLSDTSNKDLYFTDEDDEPWQSGSQIFDDEIRKRGFISPIEICHIYKMPDGFDEASFEHYIWQQLYIYTFKPDRIMNTEKYINKFYEDSSVPEEYQKKNLAYLSTITANLSNEEKEYIVNYFVKDKQNSFTRLKKFLPELKKLNPEIDIMGITPKKIFDFVDLYLGMTSRYHPEDIKYFYYLKDFKQAHKEQEEMDKILGFCPGFRMESHRMQQVIDSIITQRNNASDSDNKY